MDKTFSALCTCDRMGGGECDADKMAQTRCRMSHWLDLASYLSQASSFGCRLREESCVNKTQTETVITQRNPSGVAGNKTSVMETVQLLPWGMEGGAS